MAFSLSALARDVRLHFKHVYTRITLSRVTIAFFLVAFVHCLAEGLLQHFLHQTDHSASSTIHHVLKAAQVPREEVAWLSHHNGDVDLKVCNTVPLGNVTTRCWSVYEYGPNATANNEALAAWWNNPEDVQNLIVHTPQALHARSTSYQPTFNATGDVNGVNMTSSGGGSVILNKQCTRLLLYPGQILHNCEREDLALMGAQIWLFVVSLFAIVYSSVPHILAVLFIRTLATGWAGYSIWRTNDIKKWYNLLVVDPGSPCQYDFFPSFFGNRMLLQIADLVLSCTALVLTAYCGWHLLKSWSISTFERVGAPAKIIRIYRVAYALAIVHWGILTGLIGLWLDTLKNTAIAVASLHTALYNALFIFTAATMIPWLVMGWFAVRRELNIFMGIFLTTCFIYIGCWSAMFYSQVYRYTFVSWPFFATLTVVSFVVLFGIATAGIICWLNFGKGLAHYIHVESVLSKADFAGEVFTHHDAVKHASELNFDLARYPSTTKNLKIHKDWDSDIVVIGSPESYATSRSHVYSISLKDVSKPSTELGSDDMA